MTDIRSRKKTLSAKSVSNITFEVVQNLSGHSVKLSFPYNLNENKTVVGFRIFKAVLPQSRLKKNYIIDQRALQRVTAPANGSTRNSLYNKSLFSQNSKLKFKESNSTQHNKVETNLSEYVFMDVGFIRSEYHPHEPSRNARTYTWVDKNIKFGESYAYYITAFTTGFFETAAAPIYVNVESLRHPTPPTVFELQETDRGLLLIIGNNKDRSVSKFKLYKREDSEKDFEFIGDVDNDNEMVSISDFDIEPKRHYVYRAFCEDIYGSISLSSIERTGSFSFGNRSKNLEHQPSVYVDSLDSDYVRVRIRNESPKNVNSIRIERKDDWRFERSFNIKSYNGIPWKNHIFFDENNLIEFVDYTTHSTRAYSYRITSFNKSGHIVSYYLTPPIKPGQKLGVNNIQSPKSTSPRFVSFDVNVVNERQNPVFVKASWEILGDWSYLIVNNGDEKVRIENIHKSAFLSNFKQGRRYDISVELFDINGKKVDFYKNIAISL